MADAGGFKSHTRFTSRILEGRFGVGEEARLESNEGVALPFPSSEAINCGVDAGADLVAVVGAGSSSSIDRGITSDVKGDFII
jgi:hypothetical protein